LPYKLGGGRVVQARLYVYAVGAWLVLTVLAILNGALRNYTYSRVVGEYAGHVISSVVLIVLFPLVTYVFLASVKVAYRSLDLLLVGAIWLVLTVAFEFLFGHYVAGHPWSRLLGDYNILKGRVWALVLLAVFLAPLIAGNLARRRPA
jgi:hypothetical protein